MMIFVVIIIKYKMCYRCVYKNLFNNKAEKKKKKCREIMQTKISQHWLKNYSDKLFSSQMSSAPRIKVQSLFHVEP